MDSNGTEFVYFCQPTKKNDSPHSFSSEISFVPTNWSIKATSEGFSIREISSKKLQSSSSNTGFPSKGDGNKNTYQDNKNGSLRYLNKPWVLTLLNCRLLTRKNPGKPSFQLLFLAEVPDVVRPSQKSALCQWTHEAFLTTTDVHVGTKVFVTSTQVHHILGNFNEQKRLYDGNSQSSKTPRM